jgi:tetratricopeptide (TPR) repeat protein
MDAGLVWTAVGSAAGVVGLVLVAWQIRLQMLEHRARLEHYGAAGGHPPGHPVDGISVAVPVGRLPVQIRGREVLLAELRRRVVRRHLASLFPVWLGGRSGRTWVIAGMGGLGKTTMALAAARVARSRGWRVWWVACTDAASFNGGMLEVLQQLQAPDVVVQLVREAAPAAPERAWEFLNSRHGAGQRWMLIFDNADDPAILAASGAAGPGDYTGWLRPDPLGMVIVTTRVKDRRVWGPGVVVRELAPLDENDAARILADLAPGIVDGDGQALDLARRLGGLPLALYLAGSYLGSPFARWHTFGDYRRALDSVDLPAALADLDDRSADQRSTIQQTWDLSLDALAADGRAAARPLLFVLSCYAPAALIPLTLLRPRVLAELAGPEGQVSGDESELSRRLRSCLQGLAAVGLVDAGPAGVEPSLAAVSVHPVVADANRARMRTLPGVLPQVSGTAVRQVQEAVSSLDTEKPADWPAWLLIVPHVLALLEWAAAYLDTAALASLMNVSASAVIALLSSGNPLAAESLAQAAAASGKRLGADHLANLAVRSVLADALDRRGNVPDAEQLYKSLLRDQQRVLGEDHGDTLATRFELARVIGHTRFRQAEQLHREVLADQERVLGEEHPHTVRTRHTLAWALGRQGKGRDAEEMLLRVLDQRRRILGSDHPNTFSTRHALAWAMTWQGHHRQAEQQFRQLLADQERILGSAHPQALTTRHDLAWSISQQGRFREAEHGLRLLMPDMSRVLGDDHPRTLYARLNLARAIAGQGRHREAEQMYRQLAGDEQRAAREQEPVVVETLYSLAQTAEAQGHTAEAEQLYRRALTSGQTMLGDQHPATLQAAHLLGLALAKQGSHAEAAQLLSGVLSGREHALGTDHPDTLAVRRDLEQITHQQREKTK